jgi:putative transposase
MEARYRKNAGAVFSLKYHFVWCPKYRRPVLVDEIATRLRYLLIEKAAELDIDVRAIEIMPDHVHLFLESDPTLCVAEIVNRLKGYTSRKMRAEFKTLRSRLPCLWSRSYYAASEGKLHQKEMVSFIESQPRSQ